MYITKDFKFDAAHNLIHYHGKCEKLHGHTYHLSITLRGKPDKEGMIYDFVDLKQKVKEKILSKLDHSYINDILPQPTAEYIAQWIFKELDDAVKRENCELHEVKLWETETSSVTCTREDI